MAFKVLHFLAPAHLVNLTSWHSLTNHVCPLPGLYFSALIIPSFFQPEGLHSEFPSVWKCFSSSIYAESLTLWKWFWVEFKGHLLRKAFSNHLIYLRLLHPIAFIPVTATCLSLFTLTMIICNCLFTCLLSVSFNWAVTPQGQGPCFSYLLLCPQCQTHGSQSIFAEWIVNTSL